MLAGTGVAHYWLLHIGESELIQAICMQRRMKREYAKHSG